MCNKSECIERIREISPYLKDEYGVKSLTLFGSTARGSNLRDSDVDLFVEMPASGLKIVSMKMYLESLLNAKVDLVRKHKRIDSYFLNEVDRDGIRII